MKRLIRSILAATAALLISVGPVWAYNCAPYVSGWYMGGPAAGYLLGQKKVTESASFSYYVGGSISVEYCVGTYRLMLRDGSEHDVQLRCDTYEVWGLF